MQINTTYVAEFLFDNISRTQILYKLRQVNTQKGNPKSLKYYIDSTALKNSLVNSVNVRV